VDRQRSPVKVRLRTDERTADVLRYVFGNRLEMGESGPDGRLELQLRAQSELMMARQLAGFSDALEVLEPDAVRTHLADIGRGLLRRHAS